MYSNLTAVDTWHFLDNLSEGVLVVETDGSMLYLNSAAYQLLGLGERPNSLADLFAAVAPQDTWHHLLLPPSESYLHLAGNNLHLETHPANWGEAELVQININPVPIAGADQSKPAAVSDQLQALTRIVQKLNVTLSLEELLPAILNEAILVTKASGGQVFLRSSAGMFDQPYVERGQTLPAALALTHSQPLADTPTQPLIHAWAHPLHDLHTMLAAPITYAQEVAGLICLYGSRRNHFPKETRTFLAMLSHYAGLAIGNAARFEEIQARNALLSKRTEQTEQFVESSRVFHSNKTLEEVYEDLVYAIQKGVGFNIVLLSLIEENDPSYTLHRVTAAGLPLERQQELQQTVQSWTAVQRLAREEFALGRAYFVPAEKRIQDDELHTVPVLEWYEAESLPSPVGAANVWQFADIFFIIMRGSNQQPLGLISLDAPITGLRPDLNTAKALEIFANQAATAIENIRLYNNTREYANHLQQIHAVSQQVLREISFDTKLQLLVEGLRGVGWGRVTLTLRDKQMNPLKLVSAGLTPAEHAYLETNMLPPSIWRQRFQDPNFLRFRMGSAYFVPAEDAWAQENVGVMLPDHTRPRNLVYAWHPDDLFCLPLYDQQQRIIALIGLDQPVNGRRPDNRALQILEIYARFASSVIENSRLFGEALARTQELETLYQAIYAISSSLEQEKVLAAMGQQMRQAVYADGYAIYEWDRDQNDLVLALSFSPGSQQATPPGTTYRLSELPKAEQVLESQEPITYQQSSNGYPKLGALAYLPASNYHITLLPITIRDQSYGLVQVATLENWHQDSNESKILQAIINQASVALENARLFKETSQREQFFAALGRVSLAINATLDLPTVLDLICRESMAIFQVDGVYIWQRQGLDLVATAAQGHGKDLFIGTVIRASETRVFAAAVVNHGQSIFLNNLNQISSVNIRLPDKKSIQAILGVPLKREDATIGVMVLIDRRNPRRFREQDVELATAFGVQAAIAIQNAQLVTELRELNEQLDERVIERTRALGEERDRIQLLLKITTELSASLDETYVLNRALELINEVASAPRGGILLVDPESDYMIYRAAFGLGRPLPPEGIKLTLHKGEGLSGWIIRHRAPVLIHDTRQDSRWVSRPTSDDHRSVLAVPLISGNDVIGAIMLFHPQPHAFTRKQLELVEAAAYQVSNAVYNAQLYLLIRDQTEKLGKMLREEQIEAAKNQAILESIVDGVLVADSANVITLANSATSHILDLPRSELEGKTMTDVLGKYASFPPTWLAVIVNWANHPSQAVHAPVLSDKFTIKDRHISITLSPVLASGQFFGTVSIFRDITQAVEVDRMKSDFVSTVSHELRTPMTSIKGYADLMLMGVAGPLAAAQARYLQVIKNNADRLSMLVNDLLDISRFETGKTELDLRALDMSQLIEQVVRGHLQGRIQHEKKLIHVTTEYTPSLPLVQGDHARVTQILNNLLDNAFNYTPQGGSITVRARASGKFVYVSVADSGIGISPENQERIFERFFRAEDAAVQTVAGTGLGLSIVRSLVEMHGGSLSLESELNKGSTFTFSLPVVDGEV